MLPTILDLADDEAGPRPEGVGFWLRALARGVDLGIHLLVSAGTGVVAIVLLMVGTAIFGGDGGAAAERMAVTTPLGYVAALLGSLWLHVASEGLHGSTIGKRLLGITVVAEDGSAATMSAAVRRGIAFYLDSLFFGLVAAHSMSQSPLCQRVGDSWAHTVVVRIRTLGVDRRRSGARFLGAAAIGLCGDALIVFLELAFRLA